ncbi:MAG: hypothetical protein PHV49_07055, partial [Alistipes sp.]|nr:hypothetical protein [Alistipes sp.]
QIRKTPVNGFLQKALFSFDNPLPTSPTPLGEELFSGILRIGSLIIRWKSLRFRSVKLPQPPPPLGEELFSGILGIENLII